jgi:ATP-binding cassette subfamily B protein/ATP-binding cassette subfamily C protein
MSISLRIEAGQTVALVGPNGSGKSTLSKLIAQLIFPSSGTVLWNGQDASNFDADQLRSRVAIAHQSPFLFLHTVLENVAFGRGSYGSVDEDEVADALRRAQVGAFGKTASALGQHIGPEFGGIQPSGGQAQGISVARALFADREILILDEPTSSIDPGREAAMMAEVRAHAAARTTVIVAHRLSSVRFADIIVVLDQGRIVEQGTHDELLDRENGLYAALYQAHRTEVG